MAVFARIAERLAVGKDVSRSLVLAFVIILVGTASFGLGRLSSLEERGASLTVKNTAETAAAQAAVSAHVRAVKALAEPAKSGAYVASKNGTAYYLPTCSGASRIKDANKIWFATKNDAELAGYHAAANCVNTK